MDDALPQHSQAGGHDRPYPPHKAGGEPLMTEPLTTTTAKAQMATATTIEANNNDETGGGIRARA